MSFNRKLIFLAASGLLFSLGCNNEVRQTTGSPNLKSSSAEPVRSAGNGYRGMLTRKAMQGLEYRSGRVKVDEKLAAKKTIGYVRADAAQCKANGEIALKSGDAIGSIEWLTKAVILDPGNSAAYESLGVTLLAKGKPELAEAAFRTALDLAPNSAFSHEHLAFTLSGSPTKFEEAIKHYEKATELDPENGSAYNRLAILNYYLDRKEKARDYVALAETNGFSVPGQFLNLLTNGTSPAPRSGGGAPSVSQQVRVDFANPNAGNETTAAASNFDPDCIVTGWNDYRTDGVRSGFALSVDGGDSWQDFVIRPPGPNQNITEGDPMTAFDHRTGNLWAGAISFGGGGGVYVARKNAGDDFFQPTVMAEVTGSADKCWMAAGPLPNDPDSTRVYVGYNQGLLTSSDDGDTWSGPLPFPEFGLGWLPRVGPNGELYLTYWDAGDGVKLLRSFDGGATLEGPITIATRMDVWFVDGSRFPGRFRCAPLATSAVDLNDGTLYVTWFDTTNIVAGNSNVDIYFTKSTDQGSTWSTPTVVNTDAAIPGDQFFSWIEVDDTGRLHLLFYDSRSVAQDDNPSDSPNQPSCILEAYYAYSDDGGDSWSEIVLTPNSFDTAEDGFDGQFIGDYLGIGITGSTAFPCYLQTEDGTANVYVNKITNEFVLGDLDGDGDVTLLDVQPFVDLIVNGEFNKAADINGDGAVDVLDVTGFVALLQGG